MSDSQANDVPHGRLVAKMLLIVVGMFGFGFAMVPIYDVICEVTGLNGKTGRAAEAALTYQEDPNRTLRVEFVSTLNASMPLEFHPVVKTMEIHPGKVYETAYSATNNAGRELVGQAVPSVVPGAAASYFQKTECFCFTRQEFKEGETREMPLRFVVDPALPKHIKTLTLSYTFFDITDKEG
ncbi:MAG: cytochrome c oxidase assembly protein [Chromatiales bacterium]|nr:cytochrome c oxidase assembly protein [Chromatiales bacterium]